eukprot:UN05431
MLDLRQIGENTTKNKFDAELIRLELSSMAGAGYNKMCTKSALKGFLRHGLNVLAACFTIGPGGIIPEIPKY